MKHTINTNSAADGPAAECGKPGPCAWCDALQLTDDLLFFEQQREEDYEGEAIDRGIRLAAEVRRLDAIVERMDALAGRWRGRTRELDDSDFWRGANAVACECAGELRNLIAETKR